MQIYWPLVWGAALWVLALGAVAVGIGWILDWASWEVKRAIRRSKEKRK